MTGHPPGACSMGPADVFMLAPLSGEIESAAFSARQMPVYRMTEPSPEGIVSHVLSQNHHTDGICFWNAERHPVVRVGRECFSVFWNHCITEFVTKPSHRWDWAGNIGHHCARFRFMSFFGTFSRYGSQKNRGPVLTIASQKGII